MGMLEDIKSVSDLERLSYKELNILAEEIRRFMIENISKTGGHLASNLGTVEMTLALYRVFNPECDKIVWDVGHQAYTHKILTGRKDEFQTLRKLDGISGFPRPDESMVDVFQAGHASNSVSAALGFAEAIKLKGEECHAVAIIGDGALTGGLSYEGLNNAGGRKVPLVVVLNDNGMSISENVGGLSRYLKKFRNDTLYFKIKTGLKAFARVFPKGDALINFLARVKDYIKKITLGKGIFENLGLKYYGPIDGHDIRSMECVFEYVKNSDTPVLVHVKTRKGKGYQIAEKNPDSFHGVSGFDAESGKLVEKTAGETYSDVFGERIIRLAEKNKDLVCITAAMPQGTGLWEFSQKFPERFFDSGIAEEHSVTFASALSKEGLVPVFAVYSTFLQRAYDQIMHDTALCKNHVIFAIDRAGAVGADGETHQGIYDLSYLSHIPNMVIMAPSGKTQMKKMLDFAVYNCSQPVAVRYPRGKAEDYYKSEEKIELGKAEIVKDGKDVLIISIGTVLKEALDSAEILEGRGISVKIVDARFLKPFDEELVLRESEGVKVIATIEDNVKLGGLSDVVRRTLERKVLAFGYEDKPLPHGTISELKSLNGITKENIADKIEEEYKK